MIFSFKVFSERIKGSGLHQSQLGHYQVNYLMSVCLEGRIATGQKVVSIYRILSCKVHGSYVLGPKILLKIEKGLLNEIIQSLTLLYFIVLRSTLNMTFIFNF